MLRPVPPEQKLHGVIGSGFRVPGSGFLDRLVVFCLWNTPTLSFGFLRPLKWPGIA